MTPVQKLRIPSSKKVEERNRIYNEGETILRAITVNPDFPTCIIESMYVLFEGYIFEFSERGFYRTDTSLLETTSKEGLETYYSKHYAAKACVENRIKDTYNRRGGEDLVYVSVVYADTHENMLRYFFVKDNSLTYSNGSSAKLLETKNQSDFYQYFYGDKDGLGRYMEMGGNMD